MISCMGGWCTKRDKCQHYEWRSVFVERLCETDECFIPISHAELDRGTSSEMRGRQLGKALSSLQSPEWSRICESLVARDDKRH